MIINHNMPALNTYRQMSTNTANSSKSLEKLSSGLRINRAGDDAAGLAISEKMRAQVRGLDQASRNAQDGISMIQTAEGGLNEVHSILQRVRELADQSANGTNTADDRKAIQDEVTQLKAEVDRIGNTTEFNTQKLLNGNLSGAAGAAGTNGASSALIATGTRGNMVGADFSAVDTTTMDYTKTDALMVDGKKIDIQWNKYLSDTDKAVLEKDFATTAATTGDTDKIAAVLQKAINAAIDDSGTGAGHVTVATSAAGTLQITSNTKGSDSRVEMYTAGGATAALSDGTTLAASDSILDNMLGAGVETIGVAASTSGKFNLTAAIGAGDDFRVNIGGHTMNINQGGFAAGADLSTIAASIQGTINTAIASYNTAAGYTSTEDKIKDIEVQAINGRLTFSSPSGDISFEELTATSSALEKWGLDKASLESGGNGAMTFQIGANKGQTLSFGINDMRTSALGISSVDVSTVSGAQDALTKLDTAIKSVSSERSKIGAIQNRLEHTINNLNTSSENLTAAESRVRDVDMAKEMMQFQKNNILSQAAQAMMAQANQQPQGVLQLLR